jgi:cysteine desulfurase
MIYLDYAANSPVDKRVLDVFYDVTLKYFANPNSQHLLGLEVKELIDKSTKNIADNLGVCPEELIYTSGASEANNLVIKGICERYKNRGKHIIISSLEHSSIIAPCTLMQENGFDIDIVPVNKEGIVDVEELTKLIRDDTILVSITSIDSELGIRQPIMEIGKILKDYPNCFFHTDATHIIGKYILDFEYVDMATISPHKFYGLNGFGLLVKKKNIGLKPIINGGRSTTIYRSGTPVVGNVVALDKALELALLEQDKRQEYIESLNNDIIVRLKDYSKVMINNTSNSIPNVINFSVMGVKSLDFVKALSVREVYISTKTSCCPVKTPSKSVYALTKSKALASSSLRLSLSHLTTRGEIEEFFKVFDEVYKELVKDGEV